MSINLIVRWVLGEFYFSTHRRQTLTAVLVSKRLNLGSLIVLAPYRLSIAPHLLTEVC